MVRYPALRRRLGPRREALGVGDGSGSAGERIDRRPEYPADDGRDECKHANGRDDHEDAVHGMHLAQRLLWRGTCAPVTSIIAPIVTECTPIITPVAAVQTPVLPPVHPNRLSLSFRHRQRRGWQCEAHRSR
jgi:hypothetical protein